MGLFTTANQANSGVSIFKNIFKILLIIFIIGILFITVKLSLDSKNPETGLKFVGNLFINPTIELQNACNSLINNNVLWVNSGSVWKDIVDNFTLYDALIMSLFTIFFILWILYIFFHWMIRNNFAASVLTIFIFVIIEMLTASVVKGVSPFTPFYAGLNLFKLLWHDFNLIFSQIKGQIPNTDINQELNNTCKVGVNSTC